MTPYSIIAFLIVILVVIILWEWRPSGVSPFVHG